MSDTNFVNIGKDTDYYYPSFQKCSRNVTTFKALFRKAVFVAHQQKIARPIININRSLFDIQQVLGLYLLFLSLSLSSSVSLNSSLEGMQHI